MEECSSADSSEGEVGSGGISDFIQLCILDYIGALIIITSFLMKILLKLLKKCY
jgi:hypothetical protein